MKKKMPKGYMTDAEREELRAGGLSKNGIYLAESDAADHAGDDETAWEWLSIADLPAHTLLFLKSQNGAQFIRDMEFSTKSADKEYGADWLDKDIMIGGHYF